VDETEQTSIGSGRVGAVGFEELDTYRRTQRALAASETQSRMGDVKLSVVMAAHNEERTVEQAVAEVLAVRGPFELELIVVDDGSSDHTLELLRHLDDDRLTVIAHERCRGKGAAVMSGAAVATGTHLLVFDADLEYSALDIPILVEPVVTGTAMVVYGARVAGMGTLFHSFRYALGSKATTLFANVVFDAWLKDMHTCLKLMPLELFRQLSLSEAGFGLDTEITGEVLRRGIRPYEVPCSYKGRTEAQGKKISTRDGIECLRLVVQVRLRGLLDYDLDKLAPRSHVRAAIDDDHAGTGGSIEPIGRVGLRLGDHASSGVRRHGRAVPSAGTRRR